MYWFLVMRSDSAHARAISTASKGQQHRRGTLGRHGSQAVADRCRLRPRARRHPHRSQCPGALNAGVNFGINAARALEDGRIDGFWANGMGTEVAVRRGVGTVVLDVRRGDGPPGCFDYTFSALATSDELLRTHPDAAAAAVRAIAATLAALKRDPNRATDAARTSFLPTKPR
jgi:hypothetical protein